MYIVACIELNLVALAMCLMIGVQERSNKSGDFFGSKHFNRLLQMTILILLTNIASWITEGCFPHSGGNLHMIIMSLYFFLQTLLSLELVRYCVSASNFRFPKWLKILNATPVAFTGALLIANAFTPFLFSITADNSYHRLSMFPLAVIAPLYYIVSSAGLCFIKFIRAASYEKDIARKHVFLTITILASSILSALVYGFTPWPIIALCLVFIHINLHSKQTKELGMLAYKDALTGVHNATAHSFFMKKLNGKIDAGNAAFAIVVVDVNDLKLVNDCYGHDTGDQLLIQAARLICETYAHSPVHRIGGDEFSIILEGSDYENRITLIRRLIREMPYATYRAGNRELSVSIAVGMAEFDSSRHTRSADVFQDADRAMYKDKDRIKKNLW